MIPVCGNLMSVNLTTVVLYTNQFINISKVVSKLNMYHWIYVTYYVSTIYNRVILIYCNKQMTTSLRFNFYNI